MQQIKEQIFSHITNNEVKNYLQENIFNISNSVKRDNSNSIIRRNSSAVQNRQSESSSIMISSLTESKSQKNTHLSIKGLIKRIEGLIVVDGFWKNIQEINTLRTKIQQLKRQNLQMELNQFNRGTMQTSSILKSKRFDLNSQVDDHIDFDQHIKQATQKLQYERTKQELISIVRLSKEGKQMLLASTKHQYESMLRHITTIEKVIDNIERLHPGQAGLKLELQQLNSQLSEKRMLLNTDEQLNTKIEQLKKQIQIIQNHQPHKASLISHHQQRFQELSKKLSQFEQFLKEQQQEKHQLVKQIKEFNELFDKEQDMNKELFNKIKDNFYQYPQLIDQVVKLNRQDKGQVEFLLERLGLSFE